MGMPDFFTKLSHPERLNRLSSELETLHMRGRDIADAISAMADLRRGSCLFPTPAEDSDDMLESAISECACVLVYTVFARMEKLVHALAAEGRT